MGDRILISVNSYVISGVKCIKTFSNIVWGNVECLVFHSSSDSDLDIILALSGLKDIVKKVIYINSSINPLYYCIFTGLDADIYDSDEYLLDESIFNFLIDNYKSTEMTLKPADSDVETLAKSIALVSNSNLDNLKNLLSNPYWVKTMDKAVVNVGNALMRANAVNINVVEMLKEASVLIEMLEEGHERTSTELNNLKTLVEDMERKTKPNTAFIFPNYNVPVNVPKVLHIKEYGNCRFLMSFIIAYQHYLRMSKQYSSKILFVFPKLRYLTTKYDNMTRLASDSIGMVDLRAFNRYVTFEPKKIVLDAFFMQSGVDIFIIIDMLYGDNMIAGHMVETLYAVSGRQDIKKFNLNPKKVIMPMAGSRDSFVLPYISKFTEASEHDKKVLYFEKCKKIYDNLDKVLKI